ncbi:MAG: succinate dehydrogenase cytochrome b subunit [Bacteroidales bacterium]|nr:succinate dehydrogenase cytochrome b subunit [Bacteroidales bacterium]MDD4234710.1 succinate dehydrogenase cytochrome b subunit [Bacteroidales bacterium]MDY0160167.1 succinate dehydrogenase cytochrome b subunit [Bacteroidales bacterium]
MSNFIQSSIGKKFIMSITGLFLILFLLVHLAVNSMIVFDSSGELFNNAAHFMTTNPIIKIVEPILAAGLIIHLWWASMITLQNQIKRDNNNIGFKRYKIRKNNSTSKWVSRNMYILGTLIIVFLVIHLANFFWKMKFTGDPLLAHDSNGVENAYALVTSAFISWKWIVALYVVGAIALGLHLYHGVWSAFQTLGWSNKKWRRIFNGFGIFVSIILGGGFAFIPLFVMIKSMI